jgi:hypothetical protein
MATGSALIGLWATGIWSDLGSPTTLSALTISGYAVQPNTLGTINNRLGTTFLGTGVGGTGAAYDAVPVLTNRELAIIEGLFLISWYSQLAFATMGAGGTSIPWSRLREGDESIERANPVSIGKEYREMAKDTRATLDLLVNAYLDNDRGTSLSVDFLNPAYPYAGNYNPSNQRSVLGPG